MDATTIWTAARGAFSSVNLLATTLVVITLSYLYRLYSTDPERPVAYSVQAPDQCLPGWKGEYVEKTELKLPGSSAIQCYCPANGKLLGTINPASPGAIDRAIAKAGAAQREWMKTTFAQRRRVLRTLLAFVLDNREAISTAACLDSGKTRVDAMLGEILVTAEKLQWTILHGERALRSERRPTNFLLGYKVNEVRWEPLGVVAACFHNLMGPIISAIFAGNGIVVKASEATAWSSGYFVDIARATLHACGHSPHLVQSIVCWPTVAAHLTSHPDISHITFIGSRRVGHAVASAAAQSLTPVCMELGGKDAAVILDCVPSLEKVASILLRGVFQSAGQNCIGIERVIACQGVYDRLVKMLEPRIRGLRVGNSLDEDEDEVGEQVDVGAMISDQAFERLEALVEQAVGAGARCLVGGKRFHHPRWPRGHYFQPTLLVDVTPDMAIAREETFAPICLVMKARDVDDAIEVANATPYGLGASVFGRSRRDIDQVVAGFQAGMVSVNDFAVYYAVQLPFGGVKGSGYGRFAGEEGLRSLCNTKAVCRDRFPGLMATSIPKTLDYPIRSAGRAWEMGVGIVELGYAEAWKRRGTGLWRIIRNG
ncbi:MAG: Meiotic Sister-Chromatid recombination aldehyde dehydrogenase [Peltula sp. TS41687]|nr:MAG: Meiotic Sister-Chromatid recombination aldehyde dehydrogenase [Peltula sp. TS41687]